ncbi:hypothetical protein [Colwellia sp. 20A7]|uniref:hypothetical protein n=1 Tax=Colwellia sp. 20A7 TaxID=2689569 RepID=UPI001359DB28|nr:hypothetical protein [Colwellia sp. 20A7]
MKGYPPVILIETWLNLATNRNPELHHIKLSIREAINNFFGSMELAELYLEQIQKNKVEDYSV